MVNGKSKVKLHNYFLVKPLRLITAPSHTAPCQDLHFSWRKDLYFLPLTPKFKF